ncbi:VOC family protein [Hymenobacter sp. H14-R3]|uniref:VOC family protein n=1 Tax=Hymenobacter sp. H14-R3 TaxID=3046308 RepID=UPI0024B910EE|nr:VOC family protein [Hymenobacter sp. H14-R3]MDJ0367805.1 VOC family protein [Hymenobacter sp. H14-R3]
MNFTSVRLITADFERLVGFYEKISGQPFMRATPSFGELRTSGATLAIGDASTLAPFGGEHVASPAANRTAILEFRVADVDAEYQRFAHLLGEALVQAPTTMPWGNRSLLFRDPDGNLINFFTPATPEAIEKFASQPAN